MAGFSSLTLFHFSCSLATGPGFLPAGWKPGPESVSQVQWCAVCEGYKAPRSHHCRRCGRCVLKMDHHCPWINTCVGHRNHGHFTAFLGSAICGCAMAAMCLSGSLYYGLNRWVDWAVKKNIHPCHWHTAGPGTCTMVQGMSPRWC